MASEGHGVNDDCFESILLVCACLVEYNAYLRLALVLLLFMLLAWMECDCLFLLSELMMTMMAATGWCGYYFCCLWLFSVRCPRAWSSVFSLGHYSNYES
jgi:hypothetical protein